MDLVSLGTRRVIFISPEASLDEAIRLMETHEIHHLPVGDAGGMVGMLSDRDVLLAVGWKRSAGRRLEDGSRRLAGPGCVGEVMSKPVVCLPSSASIQEAARIMVERKIDGLPLMEGPVLSGIVTKLDLLGILRDSNPSWLKGDRLHERVADHMHAQVISVGPRESVDRVAALMREQHIRHVPVLVGRMVIGMVSDRDVRRGIGQALIQDEQAEAGGWLYVESTTAAEIMSQPVQTIGPDASLREAARRMQRIGCLPVCTDDEVVGILTDTDLLRVIAEGAGGVGSAAASGPHRKNTSRRKSAGASQEFRMNTEQAARWIREEHARVGDLADRLREKVAFCPRVAQGAWIEEVRDAFEHFRAHLTKHMSLEERGGYLESVIEQRPALSREVDRLGHEHAQMIRIMNGIHGTLQELGTNDRLLIRDCCARILNLLGYAEHHEKDENLLVMSAFTDDLGTKD